MWMTNSRTILMLCGFIAAIEAHAFDWRCLGDRRAYASESAQESAQAAREEFFELKVRPLLLEKCAACHAGDAESESVLAMDSRRTLLDGGDYGPAVVPGRAEDSLLIHAVKRIHKELRMPPGEDDALSRAEIGLLEKWINDGAVWPNTATTRKTRSTKSETTESGSPVLKTDHWAFQPLDLTAPPKVEDVRWNRSPIDQFVEARRQRHGVYAVEQASRSTLIRRATFDLTGLPPRPQEVAAFVNDQMSDDAAFAKVVDRLLASRHYGERQGRLWLDVARYADTQGDVGDIPIPAAFRYRNWVIDSLNADLPFDEFLHAQIAGDILALRETDQKKARGLVVATGFLSLSRRFGNTKKDDIHLTIEDTIDTVGRGILGLTLRCARCHDHKFDPILNTDYYGLYGIFAATKYPWMGMSNEKSPSSLAPPIPDAESLRKADEYWALITRYEYQINNHHRPWLKPTLDDFRGVQKQIDNLRARTRPKSSASRKGESQNEKAPAEEKRLSELMKRRDALLARHSGKFRELMLHGLSWIKKEKQRLADNPPFEFVFAVSEGASRDARLHRRGNPKRPGAVVPRGFLKVIESRPAEINSGSGRLELARWLTKPDHPLTARVIVNRIWQQHFGRGLVSTADNFGRQGTLPSHPQLLDYLAEEFVRDGWSFKRLHHRVMLSRTYRVSSQSTRNISDTNIAKAGGSTADVAAKNEILDPENVFLWKSSRRRLDAESIRDAMLAVSGQLDRTAGDAHPFPAWHKVRYSLNRPFHEEFPTSRRSVYMMTQRLFRNSFLGLFDGPDRNSSTSMREAANVPAQALYLMNSSFVNDQALALAGRLMTSCDDETERLTLLYELANGRVPNSDEVTAAAAFLKQYEDASVDPKQSTNQPVQPLVALCRAVLTSNEFFFID